MINKSTYPKTKALVAVVAILFTSAALAGQRLPLNDQEKDWLESVSVIITAKERKAFQKQMATHNERTEFIDLFWLKRDPDLSTELNEFKEAFQERVANSYRYAAFREGRFNAMTMEELYLLLGEPDRRYMGLDPTIHGVRFPRIRGTYPPPESWEFLDVGYGYPATSLKVQFVASSPFGDYIALTNLRTERFLDTLKQRFILNPRVSARSPSS